MKAKKITKLTIAISIALSPLNTWAQFNAIEELSALDGNNGFVFHGIAMSDFSSSQVSKVGDVNADGIDDIIINGILTDTDGLLNNGSSYIVYGTKNGFPNPLELSTLDGNNGFTINGAADDDRAGSKVGYLGDVNGDSIDDIIIGAPDLDTNGDFSGSSYVVFGKSNFPASINLSSLNGTNGFVINGEAEFSGSGSAVGSAGDFNNDGINDIFLSAPQSDNNGNNSGSSYVIFGIQDNQQFSHPFELTTINGSNGVVINGESNSDRIGFSISAAGDVNNDGKDDIIIGSFTAGSTGASYVVFGKNTFTNPIQLSVMSSTNTTGFKITGNVNASIFDNSVSNAGDVNGDGIDDVLIGAPRVDVAGVSMAGASYIVFGHNGSFVSPFDVTNLDGTNGFTVFGALENDGLGNSVSTAGDINGDGIDDIVIGASNSDINGTNSGSCTIIYGKKTGFASSINASDVDGSNGFTLLGETNGNNACHYVSDAGDINGDGIDDIILATYLLNPNGFNSGGGYVVFGDDRIFKNGFEQ